MPGSVQVETAQQSGEGSVWDALESVVGEIVEPIERGVEEAVQRAERGAEGLSIGVSTEGTRQDVRRRLEGGFLSGDVKDGLVVGAGVAGVLVLARVLGVV